MKLLFPTPVVYDGNDARYLARDGARFADYLSRTGHEGLKVILAPNETGAKPTAPLLSMGSFNQWCDSAYWESFNANGALCYFGLASNRFLPVVRAMKDAGLRLALKMDSPTGVSRWHIPTMLDFSKSYWYYRERFSQWKSLFLTSGALFRRMLFRQPRSLLSFLESFDYITAESPLAVNNTMAWCRRNRCPDLAHKVGFLPHPVPDTFGPPSGSQKKQPIVLAVALDWDNPRKGGSLAAEALRKFLGNHPNWAAHIIGKNSAKLAESSGPRVSYFNEMPSNQILSLYQSASIFFTPSGSEGNPNAVFEAACCGCSIVFPPHLEQLSWTCDAGMGTMAKARTISALAAAIEVEAIRWEQNPYRTEDGTFPPLTVSKVSQELMNALFSEKTKGRCHG